MNTFVVYTLLIILSIFVIWLIIDNIHVNKRIKLLEKNNIPLDCVIIPKNTSLKDVDPKYNVIRDVIESIKLENWDFDVEINYYSSHIDYTMSYFNPARDIQVITSIYLNERADKKKKTLNKIYDPRIGVFLIKSTQNSYVTYDKHESNNPEMENIIALLGIETIMKYHNKLNDDITDELTIAISDIHSRLITLNRDRKLNNITK